MSRLSASENVEGWYALLLAICKRYTADEAIRLIYGSNVARERR